MQLPPEVLESLALSNLDTPEPHPIDPVLFFDLVKVRRLVEEASDLAVRAANGTTTSTLSNALNAGNGLAGSNGAAALGLGLGYGGGPNAKLSKERRQRMRELACQKLSDAYHLDEIAASVATMQSASSLEEVARLVLGRNPTDVDARYVHFFHEKIPSRMLAECTTFKLLDDLIQQEPHDCAFRRTRAVTHLFKNNYHGALQDLTEALSVYRFVEAQYSTKGVAKPLLLGNALIEPSRHDLKSEITKGEDGRFSSSREQQLLFYRAGVYLSLACHHIPEALGAVKAKDANELLSNAQKADGSSPQPATVSESHQWQQEARKVVKTYAKRAAKDYMGFLSNFYYTASIEMKQGTKDAFRQSSSKMPKLLEPPPSGNSDGSPRESLLDDGKTIADIELVEGNTRAPQISSGARKDIVYQLPSLFSSSPPAGLPPYPSTSTSLALCTDTSKQSFSESSDHPTRDRHEAVTYHPLLPEALHSLLLVHCLLQTSPKEHLRHAHMVARLIRITDGYPIFLSARSPARADWIEVIRRAANWVGLQQSWEILCSTVPFNKQAEKKPPSAKSGDKAHERRRQEAIMEALADERVHDEKSFQAAVAAREKRAEEQWEEKGDGASVVQKWAMSDADEYPIGTERAEAIGRWVRELPQGLAKSNRSGKLGGRDKGEPNGAGESLTQSDINSIA